MMKITKSTLLAALAAVAISANTTFAQVDLGGAISGAINGATGNVQPPQAPNASPPKAAIESRTDSSAAIAPGTAAAGGNTTAGVNAVGALSAAGTANATGAANQAPAVNQTQGQGWLGQIGNDIRGALQQADNGIVRLQNGLNPSLQQRGFQPGDQLLDSNGQPLTQAQLDTYLQSNPGQVRVLRNGQTVVINGNAQGNMQGNRRNNSQYGQPYGQPQYGQQQHGQPYGQGYAQPAGRQRFGITMNPSSEGVQVASVTVGSPAAQAGIRPGDQIISVNDSEITNPDSMIQAVNSAPADGNLDVQYRRNGELMRSQVALTSNVNSQGSVYQAGYPASGDNRSSTHAQLTARIEQLEQTVQQLQAQVQKLNKE